MSHPGSDSTSTLRPKYTCPISGCSHVCKNAQGLSSHMRACRQKSEDRRREAQYLERHPVAQPAANPRVIVKQRKTHVRAWEKPHIAQKIEGVQATFLPTSRPVPPIVPTVLHHQNTPHASTIPNNPTSPDSRPAANSSPWAFDSIKTQYHPRSKRPTTVVDFDTFFTDHPKYQPHLLYSEPHSPFQSCTDFEFADIALKAALSKEQVDIMIALFERVKRGEDTFNFTSHRHVDETWVAASNFVAEFTHQEMTFRYKDLQFSSNFWYCDLWAWAADLVTNPILADKFAWDACILSKWNGSEFERFIHEPWTADRFWQVQSALPHPDGKPLGFIIYADQTKLSSFGGQMGYPIIARLANLPSDIRNGKGLGGGRVVGLLPLVNLKDNLEHKDKPDWVNFKRVIWHDSFRVLLKTINQRFGCWITCGDKVDRLLFPFIAILCADYEEQCVMALIRGLKGLYPCPICLIPRTDLGNAASTAPRRSLEDTICIVREGIEANLKSQSLRPVENAFWSLRFSNPFETLSWDRMHAFSSGLGGKHLWSLLKKHLTGLGKSILDSVNEQASSLPRWRGLNHFQEIVNVSFSDASKLEHIIKIALFVSHNFLTKDSEYDESGYHLLIVIRHYLILDLYLSMDVHTTKTITEGRKYEVEFTTALQKYTDIVRDTAEADAEDVDSDSEGTGVKLKSWNFPKNHTYRHAFDDIMAKGVTRGYTTKYNENMHRPLKNTFQWRTNFREVEMPLLRTEHWSHVAVYIRSILELHDEVAHSKEMEETAEDVDDNGLLPVPAKVPDAKKPTRKPSPNAPILAGRIYLGSGQQPIVIKDVERMHAGNEAFRNFHKNLVQFLLQDSDLGLNSQEIKSHVSVYTTVYEYRFLKIQFESKVTWMAETNYLRCAPLHYGRERYDTVIVQSDEEPFFAQLQMLFSINHPTDSTKLLIALVHVYERDSGDEETQEKDRDLGFLRLCRGASQFIWINSIIRGVPIFPAFDEVDQFLVFDVLDTDLMLRIREIQANAAV